MTTPRGTRYQQSTESARFAPPWTAVAARTVDGWSAMLVIPIKVLRRPSAPVQTWRFDFVRRIAALNVNESWAYDATMNDGGGGIGGFPQPGDARFWPQLTGVKLAAAQGRRPPRFEVYGLASAGEDRQPLSGRRRQLHRHRRAPCGRRRGRPDHGDHVVRRGDRARFLERRDRSADDRAARVPPRAQRVPAVFHAGRQLFQSRSRSPGSTRRPR